MDRRLLCPRYHLFEIDDQWWFPPYLREKVQSCLTLVWSLQLPLIQSSSPAKLVSDTLLQVLSGSIYQYTIYDFCAGAGGPTPSIEKLVNAELSSIARRRNVSQSVAGEEGSGVAVDFVLTDLYPHLEAWRAAARESDHLGYISEPVDAANASPDLVKTDGKKVFRIFNLAFHHFDDPLAMKILKNSIETADGFGIFELQNRTISSFITISLLGPLLLLITPFYFWRSPGHLFFTYIIPIIPFVLVFDGYISSLRTRSPSEIIALMEKSKMDDSWSFNSGAEVHTWPTGHMTWFIGLKGSQ